jgi:hypothetical protein
MEEEKQVMEGAATAARRRLVIGVGFWVQGFRLFPWLGVNFFLKDGMGVAASSLQILQASANLPMVAKPLIGLLSDAVPIRGHRRLPYVAIGGTPSRPLSFTILYSCISCLGPEHTSAITNSRRYYSPRNFLGLESNTLLPNLAYGLILGIVCHQDVILLIFVIRNIKISPLCSVC